MQRIDPGSYISPRPPEEWDRLNNALRQSAEELLKDPEAAKAFMIKHGYMTKNNKLGKRYR